MVDCNGSNMGSNVVYYTVRVSWNDFAIKSRVQSKHTRIKWWIAMDLMRALMWFTMVSVRVEMDFAIKCGAQSKHIWIK
jgi:hypothetical protein